MAFYESPRLGTRFALTSLIAFIVIGVVLAFGISGQLRKREEQAATDHALFVAKSILPYEVTTEDVISPMDPRAIGSSTSTTLCETRCSSRRWFASSCGVATERFCSPTNRASSGGISGQRMTSRRPSPVSRTVG